MNRSKKKKKKYKAIITIVVLITVAVATGVGGLVIIPRCVSAPPPPPIEKLEINNPDLQQLISSSLEGEVDNVWVVEGKMEIMGGLLGSGYVYGEGHNMVQLEIPLSQLNKRREEFEEIYICTSLNRSQECSSEVQVVIEVYAFKAGVDRVYHSKYPVGHLKGNRVIGVRIDTENTVAIQRGNYKYSLAVSLLLLLCLVLVLAGAAGLFILVLVAVFGKAVLDI